MASNRNLYKWQRQTNPMDVARGKSKDNMSSWIKKIQDASENAAKEAFGSNIFDDSFERNNIMADDEAVYEAQELLNGWLKEKSFSDVQNEMDFQDEKWSVTPTKKSTKYLSNDKNSYYKSLLDDIKMDDVSNTYGFSTMNAGDSEEDNSDVLVNEVLLGMMNKDIATGIDLGLTPLQKRIQDPTPKMNIRHKQVKERSDARKTKKKAIQNDKDIKKKAQERIKREEEEIMLKKQIEEKAIEEEMVRIRAELEEEKKKKEKEKERKEQIFEEAKLQMQMELRKQKEEENERRKQKEREMKVKEIEKEKRIQKQTILQMKMSMQILHKHFAAWYNLVLERRIAMGKGRAVADWKCKLRAWNAWKAYVACVKSNQEAKAIEQRMKENYRKEQMAVNFANTKILKLCLHSWRKYTRHKIEKNILKLEHENKARKMAMFINLASMRNLSEEKIHENKNDEKEVEKGKERITNYCNQSKNKIPQRKSSRKKSSSPEEDKSREDIANVHHKQTKIKLGLNLPAQKSNRMASKQKIKEPNYLESEEKCECGHSNKSKSNATTKLNSDLKLDDDQLTELTQSSNNSALNEEKKPIITPRARSEKPTTIPLHLAMEERAEQRRKRRTLIEAEKHKKEEERLKQLREKQEERLRREEEEKQERIRKRKEEKRIQAEKEREKQEQQSMFRAKLELSKEHYNKELLRKYGFEPLKRLLQQSKEDAAIADDHYRMSALRNVLNEWSIETKRITRDKERRADEKYREILLKRSFVSWKKCRFHLQNLNKLARNSSIRLIVKRAFRAWQDYVTDERILMWAKETDAEEHDLVRLKSKYLQLWLKSVSEEKEERIREKRRDELRRKVQTWLPDFNTIKT